jgi:hypothetical protein
MYAFLICLMCTDDKKAQIVHLLIIIPTNEKKKQSFKGKNFNVVFIFDGYDVIMIRSIYIR